MTNNRIAKSLAQAANATRDDVKAARELLTQIESKLLALADEPNKHWGHAGTAAHVRAQLQEIAQHLS